jgi:hypothetical protein
MQAALANSGLAVALRSAEFQAALGKTGVSAQ